MACAVLVAVQASGAAANDLDSPSASARAGRDSIQRVAPGVYRFGSVTVDAERRIVTMPGEINMTQGIVELLACAQSGKRHESVLVVRAEPYHIQVACLLIGLEPTKTPLRAQGDPSVPRGRPVEIEVSWIDSLGAEQRCPAEEWILDLRTRKPLRRSPWVFVGSTIQDGRFMAQEDGSIVTTYHDPYTIIDNRVEGGDDTIYGPNTDRLPPLGTPVTISIRPRDARPTASRKTNPKHGHSID